MTAPASMRPKADGMYESVPSTVLGRPPVSEGLHGSADQHATTRPGGTPRVFSSFRHRR
ncbi:hypothetical protein DIPPA_12896 [Diplonema papillatum]|nr:hypothetical protein DIPPA_12896 [Diplonema papillatum]